jgi:CRISPR-associated protein Cas4
MSDAPVQTQGGLELQPPLPVRRLHNFIYCPRLFYFQWVENIFQENADTVAGSHVHRNVDAPSKLDDPKELGLPEGAKLHSLRLESESLGLIGVVDIVEGGPDGAEIIDYKRGSARRDAEGERVAKEPDAMQVAAYALLLREHGVNAVRGAIYYAADKRCVPVDFSVELFGKVRNAVAEAKSLAASGHCPPPLKNDARCLYCSAYPICLPNESLWWAKRSKATTPEAQLQFGFAAQSEDAVRDRILEALDFAAESTDKEPTLQPPRPGGDDGEVLVVQTPGAQIGQRGEELIVSVKGEDTRKIPGHQVRAIYCYGRSRRRQPRRVWNWALMSRISHPREDFLECCTGCPPAGLTPGADNTGCLNCPACDCNWRAKSSAPKSTTSA